jgi:CRISPR-associated endonuclease Csn1
VEKHGAGMRILGLDCGIASIGWAVLEIGDKIGRIIAAGTRMFDTPETDKERRPKSELRRMYRGQRRVIRRRRQRMNAVRKLLHTHGLLTSASNEALAFTDTDPWTMRAMAHERLLTGYELAVALGHIARHRGFKSNAKSRGENDAESSKMKKAMAETQEKMAGRTFGQLIATDERFAGRKRNREGDYSRTPLRADLEAEVRSIFREQKRRQNPAASPELEKDFIDVAFFQRGLQDSEKLLADCAFEPDQKRTSKRAYSFELFRYLSRLNTFEIQHGRDARRLTPEELNRAIAAFGTTKKISFKALRKIIKLEDGETFGGIRPDDEKNDAVARHGEAAAGTATLKEALDGAAWESLIKTPEKLDRIAEVISFREDVGNIRAGLEEIGLEPQILEKLMDETHAGTFDKFVGAGHISAKACRSIIPHLAQGKVYSDAAAACGYDHTVSRERNAFNVGVSGKEALKLILSRQIIDRSLVGSPIARKALIEAVKQVKAVIEEYGIPDAIHVELARDVGKGIDERREIERGIEKRNKEKEKLRERFAGDVGQPCNSAEDLLRYELWLEQNGRCVYSDAAISPKDIVAASNLVQVDHILPWSRFGDDSFHNKTLCTARANQEKRGRTPFEWLGNDEAGWSTYVARVQSLPALRGFKRRNYTIKDAANLEEKFRSRNLNDTRWTARLLAECLKQLYPKDEGTRRVFTRPGALTDRMRRGWGLQWVKKDETGKRIPDDRHHALDAIICAATTESMMKRLTKAFQEQEALGSPRDFSALDQPWEGFRTEALAKVEAVFVSRAERRRARGEAHAATIRSVAERDGEKQVYERKRISDLKLSDLDKIKDPERNAATVASLKAWIDAEKPENAPPLSPKGDPISKVTLLTNKKPDVMVREGAVDRGEMARADVFRKKNKKGTWQYFLVPIYPHEIANLAEPPDACVPGEVPRNDWPGTGESEFIFSIGSMSLLEVAKPDGEIILHYFRALDRSTGALNLSPHNNLGIVRRSIGPRTALSFKKMNVDRLGRLSETKGEVRTWRGKACI